MEECAQRAGPIELALGGETVGVDIVELGIRRGEQEILYLPHHGSRDHRLGLAELLSRDFWFRTL